MTKYILHGGRSRKDTVDNRRFYKEITKDLPNSATILIVCFAREESLWNKLINADKDFFGFSSPDKKFKLVLAKKETIVFTEQLKDADAIYMHGGETKVLRAYLEKIPDLEKLLNNKVIAGSSAGSLVLGKYFYENDDNSYNMGLGILSYKIFCHYTKDKSDKLEKLKKFCDKMELLTIAEEKFYVIEK